MAELIKYKHYLIITLALLFALYITEPLMLSYAELKQTTALNNKRESKLAALLAEQQVLAEQLELAQNNASTMQGFMFNKPSESEFKLTAQTLLESTLESINCVIERVSWQGETPIHEHVSQWRLTVRFNGDALCIVQATKELEQLTPLMRFAEYRFISRDWRGNPTQSLTGDIDLIMWNNRQATSLVAPEQEPAA